MLRAMERRVENLVTRRQLLATTASGLSLLPLSRLSRVIARETDDYTPPPERDGGWRVGDPESLGADSSRLREAIDYHDAAAVTTSHGGALVIINKGHIIGESYVTGTDGGPRPWTRDTCNDMKSSTKKGRWGKRQLVSEEWMNLATRRYVRDNGETPNDYGYTFWVGDDIDGVPNDTFMSRGHNMNHSFIIPSMDLVVVRQGNDNRRQPDGGPPFATALIQKIVAALA